MKDKLRRLPLTIYTCVFNNCGKCDFKGSLPSAAWEFLGKRHCRAAGSINESDVLERCDSAAVKSDDIVALVTPKGTWT